MLIYIHNNKKFETNFFFNKNENIIEICKCLVVLIKEANYNKKRLKKLTNDLKRRTKHIYIYIYKSVYIHKTEIK